MAGLAQAFKGLNPLATAALTAAGVEHLTVFQRQVLQCLRGDVPHVIAETSARCGHLLAMIIWAAHCVLSAEGSDKLALFIMSDPEQQHKVANVAKALNVHGLTASVSDGSSDDSSLAVPRGTRLLIATPAIFRRCRDLLPRCVTIVFEDVAAIPSDRTRDFMELANKQCVPAMTFCLLSAEPPACVPAEIRYLLRRSNRRYIPVDRRPNVCLSTLLCHTSEEREELALRVAQLSELRRVLIMTHNREVKELRQIVIDKAKLSAHGIHRATPTNERQRVLSEFVQSPFSVLVTMDAFTGVDLMDVDAVINFYPPQKSMPDNEWDTFVACLQSTGNPLKPCLVVTVAAPDDITMVSYYLQKLRVNGPILNVAPTHPDFDDIVRNPEAALLLQGPEAPPRLLQLMNELESREQKARSAYASSRRGQEHGSAAAVDTPSGATRKYAGGDNKHAAKLPRSQQPSPQAPAAKHQAADAEGDVRERSPQAHAKPQFAAKKQWKVDKPAESKPNPHAAGDKPHAAAATNQSGAKKKFHGP